MCSWHEDREDTQLRDDAAARQQYEVCVHVAPFGTDLYINMLALLVA